MKRMILILAVLVLSLSMLTSCDSLFLPLQEQASLDNLDSMERDFIDQGYSCIRASDAEALAYCESIVAETGVILKGKVTGKIEYEYSRSGEYVYGMVIGTTCKADAQSLAEVYNDYFGDQILCQVDVTTSTYYVQVEYCFG